MGRSTVHYADNETNNILKRLHNKLRPAGTPVERVEYIIELLLLRIFEAKLKHDDTFIPLRKLFARICPVRSSFSIRPWVSSGKRRLRVLSPTFAYRHASSELLPQYQAESLPAREAYSNSTDDGTR